MSRQGSSPRKRQRGSNASGTHVPIMAPPWAVRCDAVPVLHVRDDGHKCRHPKPSRVRVDVPT